MTKDGVSKSSSSDCYRVSKIWSDLLMFKYISWSCVFYEH